MQADLYREVAKAASFSVWIACLDSSGMRSVKRRKPKGKLKEAPPSEEPTESEPMGTVRQSHGNVELAANTTLLIIKTKRLNAIKQFQDKLHHP